MSNDNDNVMLSSKDTALILGKSEAQLSNMRSGQYIDERLPFTKNGGIYLYNPVEVSRYIRFCLKDATTIHDNQQEMLTLKVKQIRGVEENEE